MRRVSGTLALAAAVLGTGTLSLQAQSDIYDRYLNHQELTQAVQDLARRHGDLAVVESLARTDEGRDVWLLTLASRRGPPAGERPALLVVANLEANHLIGSSTALFTAEHLASSYGEDEGVTRLLDERTVYVLPRMNPDGAELYRSMPGYEIPYKPHPSAPERGGLNLRELGRDLNRDGLVSMMRVRHPEGEWIEDPEDPRLLRRADRTRAERGEFRMYVEGIDTANVEAYVPMGSDGVNLNRNFPHEYLFYRPHSGPHQVSEPETRALADFMFERTNIAAVLTFSPYDNLRSLPPEGRQPPEGTAPGPPSVPATLLPGDRPYYRYVSENFVETTDLRGDGEDGEAGSFSQFAYFQVGLPSFTTPVWTLPDGAGAGAGEGPTGTPGGEADALAGTWSIHLSVQGEAVDATLTLTREAGALRGTLDSPAGSVPLEVTGQGGRFQASGDVPQIGQITVSGSASGSQMTGSVGLGPMGTASFTGTRAGGPAPGSAAGAGPAGTSRDHRWLAYFDEAGIEGYVDWTPAQHPQLGEVEVGGFRPNARVNPPVGDIRALAEKHAAFAVWLGNQTAEVDVVETSVEARGDHVFHVTATLANERYLPTHLEIGSRVRTNRPVTVRLLPAEGMTVLTGDPQQQIPRIEGMGARHTVSWLVTAAPGTNLTIEAFAERAGGLRATTLTLR